MIKCELVLGDRRSVSAFSCPMHVIGSKFRRNIGLTLKMANSPRDESRLKVAVSAAVLQLTPHLKRAP